MLSSGCVGGHAPIQLLRHASVLHSVTTASFGAKITAACSAVGCLSRDGCSCKPKGGCKCGPDCTCCGKATATQ